MTTALIENLRAIQNEYEQRLANAIEDLRPTFGDIFKPFLEAFPFVESLSFSAYTPYFNDGDECTYSVHSLQVFGDFDEYEIDLDYPGDTFSNLLILAEGGEPTSHWTPKGYDSYADYLRKRYSDTLALGAERLRDIVQMLSAGSELNGVLQGVPEDVIKGLFGDHVQVTITREGVEAEQYDHD